MAEEGQPSSGRALRDAMLRRLLGDEIASAMVEVDAIAGFDLPDADNEMFADFIRWLNPRPDFIAHWRSDPVLERKHYGRFMQGLEACRGGYAASLYHLGRLEEIEDGLHEILSRFDFTRTFPPGSSAAFGNTRRWDFEYQAFVLAYRRSLDGLAWGLSTYFKAEQSSFRQFAKALPKYHPASVATPLAAACARHMENFAFVMGAERGLSVRDRIAHREAVQAGTINVGAYGHRIIGGGENLGLADFADRQRLSEALRNRLHALRDCIGDLLQAFREVVSAHESSAKS